MAVGIKLLPIRLSPFTLTRMERSENFSTQNVPTTAGVYLFRNRSGQVIYVGKAKVLRKRLASYFRPSRRRTADPKLRSLLNSIAFFEYHEVRNEAEALLLESRLIKQYAPRYNVDLTDDKRYLLICVDPTEAFPRLKLVRMKRDDHRLYFGPFPHARVLRDTVNFLSRRFGLRTCKVAVPDEETCRHCLESAIRNCSCPCLGKISAAEYRQRLDGVVEILQGRLGTLIEELTAEMNGFAERRQFETAARRRDMIENLRAVCRFGSLRTFERRTLAPRADGKARRHRVDELTSALGLARPARVIECFDVSNISGSLAVASMVCFVDGGPANSRYRRFRIRQVEGIDDFAMMREAISRRYRRVLAGRREFPDLLMVDGGAGQLGAAIQALLELGAPPLPVLGLAKRQEEIYLPGRERPLELPRHHPGLHLLQAIRDEAHRFAIAYHRQLRRRRLADSVLNEIEGVGPRRREQLLKAFGSVSRLRRVGVEEIAAAVPGLGVGTAARVVAYLERQGAGEG